MRGLYLQCPVSLYTLLHIVQCTFCAACIHEIAVQHLQPSGRVNILIIGCEVPVQSTFTLSLKPVHLVGYSARLSESRSLTLHPIIGAWHPNLCLSHVPPHTRSSHTPSPEAMYAVLRIRCAMPYCIIRQVGRQVGSWRSLLPAATRCRPTAACRCWCCRHLQASSLLVDR